MTSVDPESQRSDSTHLGIMQVNSDEPLDAPITPSSPSSKYSKSRLIDVNPATCPFRGIVLAYWDNILGPRTRHVWNVDYDKSIQSDLLSHITRLVLSCEICNDVYKCDIDYKFYNLPNKGVIVPAFVFSAKGMHGVSVHSLYIIIPCSELSFYLEVHDVLQSCFRRLTGKFRVLLDRNMFELSVDVFGKYLSDCLRILSFIHRTSLASTVKLSDTVFCPDHVLERDFLARCVASHLMTFGKSLVVGETAERINLVLFTLSMFNSPSERRCSLPLCLNDPQPYHHDLYLQGMLKKGESKSYLPMTEVLASHYPTTIIDLTTRDVKQTDAYNDHVLHRYETIKNELICLQYGHFEELVVLDQDLHSSSAYPDTLVQTFLKEMFELPSTCSVRAQAIAQFMRMLHKRAHCLIECVRAESQEGSMAIRPQLLKKIRNDLQLNAEGDFRIVLAMAEKLKPGIFVFLKSHRKSERDFGKTVKIM